jgi:hypothetical protein
MSDSKPLELNSKEFDYVNMGLKTLLGTFQIDACNNVIAEEEAWANLDIELVKALKDKRREIGRKIHEVKSNPVICRTWSTIYINVNKEI